MHNIVITGTTGFLGKVVLLDILNNIDINKIFLLIRDNENINANERFNNIINNKFLFDYFKKYLNKITILSSDITVDSLKLSVENINLLKESNINLFINVAANINFNDPIKIAYNNNVKSVIKIINFCNKFLFKLEKLIHVSTFYVNHPSTITGNKITENLVELKYSFQEYDNIINNNLYTIKDNPYSNTYCLTKCISEHYLHSIKDSINFDITIIRPSNIANSYKFPIEGWSDKIVAYSALCTSIGSGFLKYTMIDSNLKGDIIPVDLVSKQIKNSILNKNIKKIDIINTNTGQNYNCKFIYSKKHVEDIFNLFNNNINCTFITKIGILTTINIFLYQNLFWYSILIFFFITFNFKKYNYVKKILCKLSDINKLYSYFNTNEWNINYTDNIKNNLIDYDYKFFSKIIAPLGCAKFLLKMNLNKYSIIKNNKFKSDLIWLYYKYNNNSIITLLTAYVLKKIFRIIFNDIFIDIEKIVKVLKKNPSKKILVPNHRSYCDFLLISYILFELHTLDIKLPKILANDEFKKIPLIGKLFKYLGCIFVNTNSGGVDDNLNLKIHEELEKNNNLEFFIEGTRSRSLLNLKPKTGIINFLKQIKLDCDIIPITITYDNRIEEQVFNNEIKSNFKEKMKLSKLIKWFFKSKKTNICGNVYINCGDALKLENYSKIELCNEIIRQHQLYTENLCNYNTLLNKFNRNNILDMWKYMNLWIFKYIKLEYVRNNWELEYIKMFDYLRKEDKIINNIKIYYNRYFDIVNNDIFIIINDINRNNCLMIDRILKNSNLLLGNIIINFVKEILLKNNILSYNLTLINNIKIDNINI